MINQKNAQLLLDAGFSEAVIDPAPNQILEAFDSDGQPIKYAVSDYPYGRLRSTMIFWLEKATKGTGKGRTRFVTQTNNPKLQGFVLNKPSNSTYAEGYSYLFTNDRGHIGWNSIWIYKFYTQGHYDLIAFDQEIENHKAKRERSGLGENKTLEKFHSDARAVMERYNNNPFKI